MAKIVDYSLVLERLQACGLKSLYHNSGAFWFLDGVEVFSRGWIGPPDASISQAARPLVRQAGEPFAEQLTSLLIEFWKQNSPGAVWIMPKSHWAYELQFGSREWLPAALKAVGMDPADLASLNNASAIEFVESESLMLQRFVSELLARLIGSDFQLVFADCRTICTIHSRTQLWWTTIDRDLAMVLDDLLA